MGLERCKTVRILYVVTRRGFEVYPFVREELGFLAYYAPVIGFSLVSLGSYAIFG